MFNILHKQLVVLSMCKKYLKHFQNLLKLIDYKQNKLKIYLYFICSNIYLIKTIHKHSILINITAYI